MNKIIVIGNGKLAKSIIENYNSMCDESIQVEEYNGQNTADSNTVFVHVGSGREYETSLKKAIDSNTFYIQAATEKKIISGILSYEY